MNDSRLTYLKYTPQYEYCDAVFYGNFAPQSTGFVCTQSLSSKLVRARTQESKLSLTASSLYLLQEKFRIAATGEVLELNHSFEVVKKLKLIGEPFKIYKNSAFIKGMFNTKVWMNGLADWLLSNLFLATVGSIEVRRSADQDTFGCSRTDQEGSEGRT